MRVKSGDSAIPRTALNRSFETADNYFRNQAIGQPRSPDTHGNNVVKIRNDTEANLRKGTVVEFDGNLLNDSEISQDAFWLKGAEPDSQTVGFGITLQPIPEDEIGPVQTSGTCMALVNVTDLGHKHAKVNGLVLQSAKEGAIRIDYAPGIGEVACIVTLGVGSSGPDLIVFTLNETLVQGGQALAFRDELIGGVWTPGAEVITVIDSAAAWGGLLGYTGFAFKRTDGKYEIVWMTRNDLVVAFHLNVDRNAAFNFMVCILDYSFQQGNHQPPLVAGAITIYDPLFLFKHALQGAKGYAIYNDRLDRYEALACQQRCTLARAQVNDTGGMAGIGLVTIDNFVAISPAPFDQVPSPLPTEAINFFDNKGRDNDDLLIAWDEYAADWIIIAVTKHTQNVVLDVRLNADKTKIQVKQVACALEYSADPSDPLAWVDKLDVGTC